jgi:hypothetical protein
MIPEWMKRTVQRAIEKRVKKRNARLNGSVIACSIDVCPNTTRTPNNADPRKRWIVQGNYKQEDGSFVKLNFCPSCIAELFPGATEDFFKSLEDTEKFIKEEVQVSPEEKLARMGESVTEPETPNENLHAE